MGQMGWVWCVLTTFACTGNAIIYLAVLKIKRSEAVIGSNPFTVLGKLWVDVQTGLFGANSLQLTDFNSAASAANVGMFNSPPSLSWYSASLNTVGRSKINAAGMTQLRLHFGLDDNNNHLADLIKFFSGDSPSDRPALVISYTLP